MTIGLQLWFLKRSRCRWQFSQRAAIIRHRQQYMDYGRRGRGNRARRRAELERQHRTPYTITSSDLSGPSC
jgi:hypothetical protein